MWSGFFGSLLMPPGQVLAGVEAVTDTTKEKRMAAPKIVSCEIGPYPKFLLDRMPEVLATFDNSETKSFFWFYPDELSFSEEEFIGLTEAEARRLKFEKDRIYLMS